ncbi:MAG: ABC transporter substrate-binding protein [Anaerovoracaceae bacterium]|jgi:peptide/nickel transport system substrate-binding protein
MKGKKKFRKKALMILLCLVTAVSMIGLTGCGSGGVGNDEETLVYGSGDYTAINPALYEHGEINLLLFAGLTSHDENNKVVPGLAKSWSWDESTKTYTFNLRKNLKFHDGEPLTSADVKFTLEAILDEDNQSEIATNYQDIKKIECPDDLTVKIQLERPNVAFPDYMTVGILPKHLLEGKNLAEDDFNQNPVGAGPYKLTEWDEGQSITMEAFDDYYGGRPHIKKVVFKIVEDTDARAAQLESGDLDMAQITPKDAKNLRKNDNFNVYNMETADYRAIAYNFNSKLFKKYPELTNILSYAVDRETILKSVQLGEGQVAYSPLQKNIYNDPDMEKFSYDPEKCEQLLQQDGWKKNKDGYYEKNGDELKMTIWAMEDDQLRVDMAKMCAQQLKKVGVNAEAKAAQQMDWENQDCCIIGWGSPFDADDHTYKIFTTGAGDNYTYYSNPAVDRTLTAARAEENTSVRASLYKTFQEELTEKMPYTFITYVDADYAVSKDISGITPDTILGHHGVGIFWNIADWKIDSGK